MNDKNVFHLNDFRNNNDFVLPQEIRDNDGNGGENNMDDKFATKEYVNAKLEAINVKLDALSQHIDDKFDQVPNIIENAALKEREFQRDQQKENRRFFWGTIVIGGISAVAAVISLIISLK